MRDPPMVDREIHNKLIEENMIVLEKLKHPIRMFMSYVCPKLLASIYYKNVSGRWLDWNNPQDLNAVINWTKFYSDTTLWPILADKYRVREYVKEKGLDGILVKLYGVWDKAEDIDFDKLPTKFVLKTNHGSGTNLLVKDKLTLDIDATRNKLNNWLKLRIGQETVEFHYLKIKPLIIAEEFLEEKTNTFSETLVDYKVWCFNGKVHHIWACYNRVNDSVYVSIFDKNWNYHPEGSIFNNHYLDGKGVVPRPETLDEMLKDAEILSEGFPQMRVDFYSVDGKLYLGEITMTSQGGYMDFYTDDFMKEMGDLAMSKRI